MRSAPRRTSGPAGHRLEGRKPPSGVLEVELVGLDGLGLQGPPAALVQELCTLALSSAGIDDGHVAVEFVDEQRIRELNREHRGLDEPTDVLSFAIDESGPSAGPRELGDIVICPDHTEDIRAAVVHGALHLSGMDHERDNGEMLALQAELLRWVSP